MAKKIAEQPLTGLALAVDNYRKAKKAEDAAKKLAESYREEILALMGEGEATVDIRGSEFTVTVHTVNSTSVDVAAVKLAFPGTWESQFGKVSETTRLTVK